MAKKATKAPATGETKKYNSAGKKRSAADLKGSEKGSVIRVIRGAASLANQKDRAGLPLGDKNSSKNLAGRLNAVVKPNGKIDMMDSSSDSYKSLLGLAKSALPSLKSSSYDSSVKELLNFCLTQLGSTGGGGKRGFNPGALEDISF